MVPVVRLRCIRGATSDQTHVGVLPGTAIGVLPGLGPLAIIAMLLPITHQIQEPVTALIMLAGTY